jgi:TPR repeat protein
LLCHAAEQGDNLARYHAAKRILTARCSGDDAKGLRYARMAADAGERNAQFLIGCRLMSLEGEQDSARRYLQMAAARGHSGAKSRLAEMLTVPSEK